MGLMQSGPEHRRKRPAALVLVLWLVAAIMLTGWIAAFALHV